MPHATDITSPSWFLCYTPGTDHFHFGFAPESSHLTTGQSRCELFDSEFAMAARADELNGEGWYEDNKPIEPDPTPVSNVT